ncbi:MAG: hypothetical protein ACFB0D_13545 [Phormidesmis sp.]
MIFSKQLLALSLGVGCCFSGSPAIAQLSELSAIERIEEISEKESQSRLYSLTTECDVVTTPSNSDLEFIRSVLSLAAEEAQQIEDIEQQASAFPQIAKSYACIGQAASARRWLEQALSVETDYSDESAPPGFVFNQRYRLLELAKIYSQLLGESEPALALLANIEAMLDSRYGQSELTLAIAELYGEMGNIEQMNKIISDVVATVEIETEEEGATYFYPALETSARLYAKFGQHQRLRQLIDDIDVDYVREDVVTEAAPSLLQVASFADRAAIAQLFSDFNIVALAADTSTLLTTQRQRNPEYDYRSQLRDTGVEQLSEMSDSEIEAFIAEQKELIAQRLEPLPQTMAYPVLAEALSDFGHPERALLLLEESLQLFSERVSDASLAGISQWDVTEDSYRRNVQASMVKALVRTEQYDQAFQLVQTMEAQQDISLDRSIRFRTRFADWVSSPTYAPPDELRLTLLAEAEALAPQIADKAVQLETWTEIAEEYLVLEELSSARQLAPSVETAFEAVIAEIAPGDYSVMPEQYSEFLLSIGEYEQAITLAEIRKEDLLFTRKLPAQFVAVGEYELADELRAAFEVSADRLVAGREMVSAYQGKDMLDEAFELTTQLLDEALSVDLAAEAAAGGRGLWGTEIFSVQEERISRVEWVLNLYRPGLSSISYDMLSTEEVSAIGIELAKTIESDWLRYAAVLDLLTAKEAIAFLEADSALPVPDSLLMQRVLSLVNERYFPGAVSMAERMRSPYVKTLALTHIATRYLSTP